MPKYSKCDTTCQCFIFSLPVVAKFFKWDITKREMSYSPFQYCNTREIDQCCNIWADVSTYGDILNWKEASIYIGHDQNYSFSILPLQIIGKVIMDGTDSFFYNATNLEDYYNFLLTQVSWYLHDLISYFCFYF